MPSLAGTSKDTSSSSLHATHEITKLRKKLCQVIASLSSSDFGSCPDKDDTARNKLSAIILEIDVIAGDFVEVTKFNYEKDDDRVTPLMVACDRALPHVLKLLLECRRQILTEPLAKDDDKFSEREKTRDEVTRRPYGKEERSSRQSRRKMAINSRLLIIGNPSDQCSPECGGNSAAHFAANKGCLDCLDLLIHDSENETRKQEEISHLSPQAILSQTNSHGDTPSMMAIAAGHSDFLRHVLKLFESNDPGLDQGDSSNSCSIDLSRKNRSGDTALSLAYGHGHLDMVQMLVQVDNGSLIAKYDVDRCKCILSLSNAKIRNEKGSFEQLPDSSRGDHEQDVGKDLISTTSLQYQSTELKSWERRRNAVEKCLEVLEGALSAAMAKANEQAKRMEMLLLSEEMEENSGSHKNKERGKKKRKKKKGGAKAEQQVNDQKDKKEIDDSLPNQNGERKPYTDSTTIHTQGAPEKLINVPLSSPRFATLENGIVVSDRKSQLDTYDPQTDLESPSLEIKEQTVVGDKKSVLDKMLLEHCPDAESLSLDVSMLLLTPHKMAMQLSPCQLDNVKKILEKQLKSVEQARQIQLRLRQAKRGT